MLLRSGCVVLGPNAWKNFSMKSMLKKICTAFCASHEMLLNLPNRVVLLQTGHALCASNVVPDLLNLAMFSAHMGTLTTSGSAALLTQHAAKGGGFFWKMCKSVRHTPEIMFH
jgi:hypothetical protein